MRLFSDRQQAQEALLRKFEQEWSASIDLAEFYRKSQFDADGESALRESEFASIELLSELVLIDIELRLKAGLSATVEEYLVQFPQLRGDPARLVEMVQAEFRGRSRTEPDLQWDEFRQRFPEVRDRIAGSTTRIADRQAPNIPPVNCLGDWTRGSGRFRLLRTHREGGLGKVWLAHDQELDREIIVKEIRDEYADDDDSRSRFAREAVITSALEHPGVVPVYGLGHRHDGRPYYAMRLVRGRSLRQSIEEFHANQWESSGARLIALHRLLNHFLDVCHTIEFAHRQGIIHRDLKPNNIMIGEFGETMVVDWGLAKDLSESRRPGSAQQQADGELPTQAGRSRVARQTEWSTIACKAMGSPSYMSPEQARGDQSNLGPTTDVYGLGSTLYTLLSNRRPVEGSNSDEVMLRVQQGNTVPLSRADTPRALLAICEKAMAYDPVDRYASARAVADDVERYLADEPVDALEESWVDRATRFARRNHPLVRAAAAALVAITLLAAGSALLINGQRQRAERLAVSENAAQRRTQEVLEFFVDAFQLPILSMQGAEAITQVLDDAVDTLHERPDGKDPLVTAGLLAAFSDVYQNLGKYEDAVTCAKWSVDIYKQHECEGTAAELMARETLATAHGFSGDAHLAVALLEQTSRLRAKVDGPDADKTIESRAALSRSYAVAGRLQDAAMEAEAARDLLHPRHKVETRTSVLAAVASSYSEVGRIEEALKLFKECMDLAQGHLEETSFQRYSTINNYAAALLAARRYEEALQLLEPIASRHRELFGEDHPNVLKLHDNLAKALVNTGQTRRGIELLESSLNTSRRMLGESHPSTLSAMNDLAWAYGCARQFDEATALLEESVRAMEARYGKHHPDTLTHLNNLARSYMAVGKRNLAIKTMSEVIRLRTETLPADHPFTLQSLNGLGFFYECAGQFDLAIDTFEQTLVRRRGSLGNANLDTFMTRHDLGHVYLRAGRVDDAIRVLSDQLKLLNGNTHKQALDLLAAGRTVLAEALLQAGRVDEAHAALDLALDYFQDSQHHYAAHAQLIQAAILDAEGDEHGAASIMPLAYEALCERLPMNQHQFTYRLIEATERLERLFERLGQPDQVRHWQQERRAIASAVERESEMAAELAESN